MDQPLTVWQWLAIVVLGLANFILFPLALNGYDYEARKRAEREAQR